MEITTERLIDLCKFKRNGHWIMWVYEWGRDCDQCESDSMYTIAANIRAFEAKQLDIENNAEGSTAFWIASQSEHETFEPSFRDRRAEQYNY